jgi:hypothetical protein
MPGAVGDLAPADTKALAKRYGGLSQLRDQQRKLRCLCSAADGHFYVCSTDLQRMRYIDLLPSAWLTIPPGPKSA